MLTLKDAGAKGRGVFATEDIPANTEILRNPTILINYDQCENNILKDYVFAYSEKQVAICFGMGSMFNHSANESVDYQITEDGSEVVFTTTKDIEEGEELFINYGWEPKNMVTSSNKHPFPDVVRAITQTIKASGKAAYCGDCVLNFDSHGECLRPELPYRDVTDFAQSEDRATKIPKAEFLSSVNLKNTIKTAKHKIESGSPDIEYLYDEESEVYMAYDTSTDTHYFYFDY